MNIWQRLWPFRAQAVVALPETVVEPVTQTVLVEAGAPTSGDIQIVRPIGRVQANTSAVPPDVDLTEVNRIYTIDSYARQAVSRYIEFMFKQGWDFVAENPTPLQYLKTRFDAMAEATATPGDQLFIEMAEDLVKFHNCFVLKARDASFKWPKGIKVRGIYGRDPVVGLFVSDPTAFKVLRDKTGTIKRWEYQPVGADKATKLRPEDVVHMAYQKQRGQVFGHPFLLTAREDIRALRQLEDLVLRMVYRNIFPFIHYQVGTPEAPATDPEIDQASQYIEAAKTEGGLVTSERHKISAVALDKVIDVSPHLKYFESRVFTSVGVPEVLMGRGGGASRATSDNLHVEFIDRVKAYQRVIESYINHFLIRELLLEGGFDPMLNTQDDVKFRFREIDFDALVKRENEAIYKFEHNAETFDEMRMAIGKNPQTDEARLYLNMIQLPLAQGTAAAKAAVAPTNKADTANRVAPKNQHTTKQSLEEDPLTEVVDLDEAAEQLIAIGERHALSDDDLRLLREALQEATRR